MLLSDLFKYLSNGELSQFSMGTDNSGKIAEKDYEKVIAHINLGLTNLHTRLPLKQAQVIIRLSENKNVYPLPVNDVLKIEEVYSEAGTAFALNDPANEDSLYTPAYNVLQVPNPTNGTQIAVLYRANHKPLPMKKGIDPMSIEVDIPDTLIEALMTYVVSRVMQSRGTAESISEANAYTQRYELLVQQLQMAGALSVDRPTNTRMRDNGWV